MKPEKIKLEKELILSDAEVMSVLRAESNKIGVTIEEYVDRFLQVFYDTPKKFYSIIDIKKTKKCK